MNDNVNNQEFQLLSLKDIFENRYFVIPDYQRGYSWEAGHQVKDLINDVEHLFGKDHKHFTGTIVAAKLVESQNTFEIVDGQQRLTTLIILLKQLYDFDPLKNIDLYNLFIQRGDPGNEKVVLTTNEETRLCFQSEIINNTHYNTEIKSHECMVAAKKALNSWLKDNIERIDEIKSIITNRLGFIFFSPVNDKEIGIMFEVINNRGKALSELEKIKNYFIYYASVFGYETLRTTVNDNWKILQRNLSQAKKTTNDDENTFLRNCYIVFFDNNKAKSWYVYDELKLKFNIRESNPDELINGLKILKNFIRFITDASLHYAYFFNEAFFQTNYSHVESKSAIQTQLAFLRCQHVNASIMPLYLSIMSRLDEHDKVLNLLELLEKANFRMYVLPGIFNRADSKQGHLFYLANEFYKSPDMYKNTEVFNDTYIRSLFDKGDVFDWLEFELSEMVKHLCPLKKVAEVLTLDDELEFDYHGWLGIKYLLACYEQEQQCAGKKTFDIQRILVGRKNIQTNFNDHLSIEHIWAKQNRVDMYPASHKEKRRLGNFVLLGLSANIQLQNFDIPTKVDELRNFNTDAGQGGLGMHQVAELSNFLDISKQKLNADDVDYYLKLSMKINDAREMKLINFTLSRWRMKQEVPLELEKIDSLVAKENGLPQYYTLSNAIG